MDDPNKSAKEAFQKMLEDGQLSSSAYLPSRLQLQRAVWQLQKENNELRKQIEGLETRIKEASNEDTK
jgi:cell division protein FtsB